MGIWIIQDEGLTFYFAISLHSKCLYMSPDFLTIDVCFGKDRCSQNSMFNATVAGISRHGGSCAGSRSGTRHGSLAGSRRGSRADIFAGAGMPSMLLKVQKENLLSDSFNSS